MILSKRSDYIVALALTHTIALAVTSALTLTVALALCADIVAKQGSKDEVFFRCELVQRSGDDEADGLHALTSSEIDVQVLPTRRLQYVRDALTLQS